MPIPPGRCLLIFAGHVPAGLSHGFYRLVESDFMASGVAHGGKQKGIVLL